MDYFYAQVEERDNPSLKGIPVGVGGITDGRGVLCTSNYIARKFGVRAAMPTIKALQLCPNLKLVKPDFKKYKAVSEEIFEIYAQFTKKIQKLSLDEAYLDVTDCNKFNNNAVEIAKEIKRRILGKTRLTASAGVSYNKLLAKIGSDLHKPDGIAILRPENISENISNFSIAKICGVGKVTQKKMNSHGIETFGDLQGFSKLNLINMYGDFGASLFDFCRGIDNREVTPNEERKSLSVEHTFSQDISDEVELVNCLSEAHQEMILRLDKCYGRMIKSIFVKIKYHDFSSTTIESQIVNDFENFKKLFHTRFELRSQAVRLLGVGVRFYPTKTTGQLEFSLV
jgi:DNA polymerase-4